MGLVTFNYSNWLLRYPELANTKEPLAGLYFLEAEQYLQTGSPNPVSDVGQATLLLNMLTAHIACLNNGYIDPSTGAVIPPTQIVGRIATAAQGSVNIGTSTFNEPMTVAWFVQTKYGFAFWQATAAYRTARYRPSFRSPLVAGAWGGRRFI